MIVVAIAALTALLGVVAGIVLSITTATVLTPDAGAPLVRAVEAAAAASEKSHKSTDQAPAPVASSLSEDAGRAARTRDAAAAPASPPPGPDASAAPPDRSAPPDLRPPPDTRAGQRVKRGRKRKAPRWRRRRPRPKRPEAPRRPTPQVKQQRPPAMVVVNVSTLYRDQFVTADVYLDGKHRGQSPLVIRGVPAGIHLVEARQKGYKRSSAQIRLLPGRSSSVVLNLRKK